MSIVREDDTPAVKQAAAMMDAIFDQMFPAPRSETDSLIARIALLEERVAKLEAERGSR